VAIALLTEFHALVDELSSLARKFGDVVFCWEKQFFLGIFFMMVSLVCLVGCLIGLICFIGLIGLIGLFVSLV